ncbi:MAG: N-acetylmuramoyl-L-alanine amidase AmiB [Gammaproteobacteria bacterium]
MTRIASLLLLILIPLSGWAQTAKIEGIRLWAAPDNTRIVFDIDGPVEHTLFPLHGPERIVVDLNNTRLVASVPEPGKDSPLVKAVRHATRNRNDLRVVFDLTGPVRPKSFLLKPNEKYGHRLVIDLYDAQAQGSQPKVVVSQSISGQGPREVVIAIDAGHGGEDPGAIGRQGTREKDVVFQIAKRLARLVDREYGMRHVMIRQGDYYIPLKDRYRKAREAKADLLISIHADGFHDHRARGSSVYVLSKRGATNAAAAFLAEQENAADRIGGVSLEDKDDLLKTVLLDLSQAATIEDSLEVAGHVHRNLSRVNRMHSRRVQQAGFVVLKSPDVPSILVETAFITNPHEERNLRSARHQQRVAEAIMKGVKAYFTRNPPVGTLLANSQHVIRRGETLSGIARRYRVSLQSLREANNLYGDLLTVGSVLRIPREPVTLTN